MFPTFHHPPKPRTYPSTTTTTPPSSDLLGSQDTSLHHARRQRGPLRRQVFFSKEEEEEYERLKMERQQFEKDEMETKKSLTDDFLKGVCTTKCSRFEYLTRCVQQDIHPLEMENGRPKFENCVKKYQRSYAGASQHPNDLRPLDTLLSTQTYLLDLLRLHPLNRVYAFIWDRFRAIRRDISTQQIMDPQVTTIYEQIIRFHLLCLFLRPPELDRFQELTQLNAALSDLLYLYQQGQSSTHEIEFYCYDTLLYVNDTAKRVHLFQHHPSPHPFLHGTRCLLPLMGVSDTKLKSLDFAHYIQTLLHVPLGLALVASLHLDRLRRNVLAEMVFTGYHREGNLATKATVSDLVQALHFEHEAQCVSFVTYFGVPLMEDHVFGLGDKVHWNRCVVDLKKPEATKFHPHFLDPRLASMSLVEFIVGTLHRPTTTDPRTPGSLLEAKGGVGKGNEGGVISLDGAKEGGDPDSVLPPMGVVFSLPPSPKASPKVFQLKRSRSPSPFKTSRPSMSFEPLSKRTSLMLPHSKVEITSPSSSVTPTSIPPLPFPLFSSSSNIDASVKVMPPSHLASSSFSTPHPFFSLETKTQPLPSVSSSHLHVPLLPTSSTASSSIHASSSLSFSSTTLPSCPSLSPSTTSSSSVVLTRSSSPKPVLPISTPSLTSSDPWSFTSLPPMSVHVPLSSPPPPPPPSPHTVKDSSFFTTTPHLIPLHPSPPPIPTPSYDLQAPSPSTLKTWKSKATTYRTHALLTTTFRAWRKHTVSHFVRQARRYRYPDPTQPLPSLYAFPMSTSFPTKYMVSVSDTYQFMFSLIWPLLQTRLYGLQQVQRRHYIPWVMMAATNHVFALMNAWVNLLRTPLRGHLPPSSSSSSSSQDRSLIVLPSLPMLLTPVSQDLTPQSQCLEDWYMTLTEWSQRLPSPFPSHVQRVMSVRSLAIPFGDVLGPVLTTWVHHALGPSSRWGQHDLGVLGLPWAWYLTHVHPALEAWVGDMLVSMDWVCQAMKSDRV